jgi:hypothetical protein
MLGKYHAEIVQTALGAYFSPADIEMITAANLGLDVLAGQIGHPEYHFDDSAFAAGEAFICQQRQAVVEAVRRGDRAAALAAFGRLTHTRQDFYAHSNWLRRWVESQGGVEHCQPDAIPLCLDPLPVPELISGRSSIFLYIVHHLPRLGPLFKRLYMPPQSHEAMNLDHPGRGPLFSLAMAAAIAHTRLELTQTMAALESAGGAAAAAFFAPPRQRTD